MSGGVALPALQETCTFDPPDWHMVLPTQLQVLPLPLGFPECRETPAFSATTGPRDQMAGPQRGPHEAPLTEHKVRR